MATRKKAGAKSGAGSGAKKLAAGKSVNLPSKENTQQTYRALQYSPTRQYRYPVARSEEWEQRGHRTGLAWNSAHDLVQNVPLVGWAIRTYLDFTTSFDFQPATDDPDYNLGLKTWFKKNTGKNTVDIQRKYDAQEFIRQWAYLKILGGDSLIAKLPAGKCQLFEAFQIAKGGVDPKASGAAKTKAQKEIDQLNQHGLVLDDYGAVVAYGIATGDSQGGLIHRMLVPWQCAIYGGWFTRPSTSRPFSPLLPAITYAQDYADNVSYKLTQCKIHSMLSILVKRDSRLAGLNDFHNGALGELPGEAGPPKPREPVEFEFRPGSKLEVEKDEDAKFLESTQPSTGWLEFTRELGRMILSCLDLPYAIYDSTGSNYTRAQFDMNKLRIATRPERQKNQAAFREMIDHILDAAFAAGEIQFPAGVTEAADLPYNLVSRGSYVVDLAKESDALMRQVAAGLRTNASVCGELGLDEFDITTPELGREQALQRECRVTVAIGLPGQPVTEDAEQEPEEPTTDEAPDEKDSDTPPAK